jgi:hypothetical protein
LVIPRRFFAFGGKEWPVFFLSKKIQTF